MPYYIVTEKVTDSETHDHPVKAKNQAQALAAIVDPKFTIRLAETEELLALTQAGVKVIEAK